MSQLGGFKPQPPSNTSLEIQKKNRAAPKCRTRKSRKNHYLFFLVGCVVFELILKLNKMLFLPTDPPKRI